jgi:glycosyltransferase involved in cell wall biosynthesis
VSVALARAVVPPAAPHVGVPRVAVVMAAHNAERTIREAVDSLLNGTLPCRIFIVDDASSIPVNSVLADVDRTRIEVIRLDRNVGPSAARNAALARVLREGYSFVAIMDADDVAHPERLARQVAFLEAYPQVGLVGSWVRLIDEQGAVLGFSELPCTPQDIRARLPLRMCVSHPSWLVRASVLAAVGLYSPSYRAAEDYELLRRIAARYDIACLPAYLLDYRLSSGGITMQSRTRELFNRIRIQLTYFEPFNWRCWAGVVRTLALSVMRVQRDVQYPGSRPRRQVVRR